MNWSQIKYQPEWTKTYLGSPSIVRLADGALLASHDYFGLAGCPKNHEGEESLTSIYRSEDNGATWANITHIMNCYWSSLFRHDGAVYILGNFPAVWFPSSSAAAPMAASPGRTRLMNRAVFSSAAVTITILPTTIAGRCR